MASYKEIDSEIWEKAGDFNLPKIELVSYKSYDNQTLIKKDITALVAEVNIYESLFDDTLSGNLVVVDTFNLPYLLPITGYEKVEFQLSSPGFGKDLGRHYDFTEKSGHPMYVYKITDRKTINDKTQIYTLHFCSRETIRNEQVRVSKAYTDGGVLMTLDLLTNEDYIDTKKPIFFEESKELFKYVVPNLHPFSAIRKIAEQVRPANYNSAGYMFYEDASGFKFRSIESMLAKNGKTRISTDVYTYSFRNLPIFAASKGKKQNTLKSDLFAINKFNVKSQSDTIKTIRAGVAASKLLTHDSFNKTFKETEYDYHKDFTESHHTESRPEKKKSIVGQRITEMRGKQGAFALIPWTKYDRNNYVTDHSDSVLFFKSTTEKIHDNAEFPPVENILQKRISQINAFDTFRVEIEVPGFTGVRVGEKVTLSIQSIATVYKDEYLDKQLSGDYLIAKIRHIVTKTGAASRHSMVMELIKDSYLGELPVEINDNFSGRENDNQFFVDQYTLDKQVLDD